MTWLPGGVAWGVGTGGRDGGGVGHPRFAAGWVHGVWGRVDAVEAVSAIQDLLPRRVNAVAAV